MRFSDEHLARATRAQRSVPNRGADPAAGVYRCNAPPDAGALDAGALLNLQRLAGNSAVTSLLSAGPARPGANAAPAAKTTEVGAPQPRLDLGAFAFERASQTFAAIADKSETENENEEQDQSIDVGTFAARTGGVRIAAEVGGGFDSTEYPDGFKFTQTIQTNAPLRGATSPYVDPQPNDDMKPFYWTDAQQRKYPTTFKDHPWRYPPTGGAAKYWQATLALNGVDEASNTVTGFDYITYGFVIDPAGTVTLNYPANVDGEQHRRTLMAEFSGWTFS